jgi:hypothetical protein
MFTCICSIACVDILFLQMNRLEMTSHFGSFSKSCHFSVCSVWTALAFLELHSLNDFFLISAASAAVLAIRCAKSMSFLLVSSISIGFFLDASILANFLFTCHIFSFFECLWAVRCILKLVLLTVEWLQALHVYRGLPSVFVEVTSDSKLFVLD